MKPVPPVTSAFNPLLLPPQMRPFRLYQSAVILAPSANETRALNPSLSLALATFPFHDGYRTNPSKF
jgi:hypothetical protein